MSNATPQKFEFQAEIKQLLDIVIHSLYTEKEIFVRELVSNASDALEKLRHTQLTEKEIFDDKLELEINVTTDDKAKTITFQDFGLGMSRADLVENLGTIAHSGSKAFLKALGPTSGDAFGKSAAFITWQDRAMNKAYYAKEHQQFTDFAVRVLKFNRVIKTDVKSKDMVNLGFQ